MCTRRLRPPCCAVQLDLRAQDEAHAVQLQQPVRRLRERCARLFEPYGMGEVCRGQQVDALGLSPSHQGVEVQAAASAYGEPGVGMQVRDRSSMRGSGHSRGAREAE